MADEIGTEQVGPVAACSVSLRSAGQVEFCVGEEGAFNFEAGAQGIFGVFRHEQAQIVRAHARVKILADFQGDPDIFRERRRNVFGDLIFGGVEALKGRKIRYRALRFFGLDLDARGADSITKRHGGKLRGRGNGKRGSLRGTAGGYIARENDVDGAIGIGDRVRGFEIESAVGRTGDDLVGEVNVGGLR